MTVLPKIDPKYKNYDKFSKGYNVINYSVLILLFLVNIIGIGAGLGYDIPMNSTPHILVGLLFIVIGNYLPQCKPNYFVGIKTPWTLSNEEVWRKTHRFSGKVFVVLGVIMILSIFAPVAWKGFPIIGIIVGAVGLTMGYSYVAYKKKNVNKAAFPFKEKLLCFYHFFKTGIQISLLKFGEDVSFCSFHNISGPSASS